MLRLWFTRLTNLDADELTPAALSCAYFFCILSGYYILRPLREEMGLGGIAFIAVPLAVIWGAVGLFLGRHQNRLAGLISRR